MLVIQLNNNNGENKINKNIVKNILNDMLTTLDEFKSEDIKYYKKQVLKIVNYVKTLENKNN